MEIKPVMIMMMLLIIVSLVFAIWGIQMQVKVTTEEAEFHALQSSYFGLSKATREAAPDGAELNQQLVKIQNYPSELLRLKLVGVGKILTGIYVLLLGILVALVMMPGRLAAVIKKK